MTNIINCTLIDAMHRVSKDPELSPNIDCVDQPELVNFNIFDLTLSINHRYKLLINMDKQNQFEITKRLVDIYRLTGVKKLEKFFIYICIFDSQIDLYLKQEILYILSSKLTIKNKKNIKQAFSNVLFLMIKQSFIYNECWLMFETNLILYYTLFKDPNMFKFLKNFTIISLKKLKSSEPIKKIFKLITHFKDEYFFMDLCTFIFTKYNKILMVKNNLFLLQIIFKDENIHQTNLFSIVNNDSIELSLRLEACDILYLNGSKNIKDKVQIILENIIPNTTYTNNHENVHLSSVVKSVDKTIDSVLKLNKGKEAPSNLYNLLLDKFSHNDKVKGSLNRIFNYSFLKFTKYNLTLKDIIENVWLIINQNNSDLQHQLYIRLEQELMDMYNTCSQGYATRLINVLTGFEINGNTNLGISLSYEDEIYAIFSNKINNVVARAPEELKEQLLEELMVPSNQHDKRLNLIRYLRPHIPQIWNEIYNIFETELSMTDLDLYCRKVTMKYDGYDQ